MKTHATAPQDIPAYGIAEAARYLKMAPATLRSWTVGRSYPRGAGKGFFRPLIALSDGDRKLLSFANLVEAHVLRALRTVHEISVKDLRKAIRYAEAELGVEHLLVREELYANRELFIRKYGTLINLSRSGQYAMDSVLEAHLDRLVWKLSIPVRLYPFLSDDNDRSKVIVIDPALKFGRPVSVSRGISTEIIVKRVDAGESVEALAKDYDLRPDEITAAILYERAT
ncbi:MAG: DUF433 domain-containing protein [Candidatus Latescibacteria bacterium]|nr:DUF433 domain-containing protein [Candidatus Latescibacterota bacterium]